MIQKNDLWSEPVHGSALCAERDTGKLADHAAHGAVDRAGEPAILPRPGRNQSAERGRRALGERGQLRPDIHIDHEGGTGEHGMVPGWDRHRGLCVREGLGKRVAFEIRRKA